MKNAACAQAQQLGLNVTDIRWVPGSMEKPLAVKRLLTQVSIDGAVVLGIIERGETAHGQTMGQAVIQSLINLQLETNKPVGIGILGQASCPNRLPTGSPHMHRTLFEPCTPCYPVIEPTRAQTLSVLS